MNRGRHKKSKKKEFNTQAEILDTIQKELRVLYEATIKNSIYTIKFAFGKNLIEFKYKHE